MRPEPLPPRQAARFRRVQAGDRGPRADVSRDTSSTARPSRRS